ncbi:hypothetical protein [Saccharopolyspora shandongensis]|uniref:hypothetical protein n=1 Tax=Saccharopolyspora shandongensis TaxID=418495 RepID=UPI0034048D16
MTCTDEVFGKGSRLGSVDIPGNTDTAADRLREPLDLTVGLHPGSGGRADRI